MTIFIQPNRPHIVANGKMVYVSHREATLLYMINLGVPVYAWQLAIATRSTKDTVRTLLSKVRIALEHTGYTITATKKGYILEDNN